MKKFISMVMAAAMVVSMVPATAFAATTATFKVVGDAEITEEAAEGYADATPGMTGIGGTTAEGTFLADIAKKAEVQIKLTSVDNKYGTADEFDLTLSFDGTEALEDVTATGAAIVDAAAVKGKTVDLVLAEDVDAEDDSFEFTLKATAGNDTDWLEDGDVVVINMAKVAAALQLTYTSDKDVTVEVDGDFGSSDAMPVVTVLKEGLSVTLKKIGDVAEEATKSLKSNLVLEANVGEFAVGQRIELKLNSGFEWTKTTKENAKFDQNDTDDDVLVYYVAAGDLNVDKNKITFDKDLLEIDAVSAKAGSVAKITVKVKDNAYAANGTTPVVGAWKDTVTVEALKVVDESITLSVEEDEDLPELWSGVAPGTDFINTDSDFKSLEITIEESVVGALDVKKDLELMLTPGVYVTGVEVTKADAAETAAGVAVDEDDFAVAYKEGKHEGFVFDRKTFVATDDNNGTTPMELSFVLELMAVPGFEGDVELTLSSAALEDELTVTIATFKAPYTVEAAQNDLIIDYRHTEVPTTIKVTEAEAGLWAKDKMSFSFDVDKMDDAFEGDATYTVNAESEMEIDDLGDLGFTVDEESDDEAAVVTISGIELYMQRNLPAGAYDLELSTPAGFEMMTTALWSTEAKEGAYAAGYYVADIADWKTTTVDAGKGIKGFNGNEILVDGKGASFVGEASTVKEAFINIITAGRDQDDASFTKKVVVPVGESYIVAGEETVALDVPAYINANGYTMLPVRAVAVALGINDNNVIWSQAAKQVTILYGQRIITMTVGQNVVYVNGSAIPASAAVEITNNRTFLGLRDLANALGVTTINWDAATQTASLN